MKRSKRGAALAYVIMTSAVLFVLASGLILAAKNSIGFSQNTLEGRQAYLDAKSAIEYGKEYIRKNPNAESFYIKKDNSSLGFDISSDKNDAVAFYDRGKRTINAAGKYKSSNGVKRLGYKFEEEAPVEDFISAAPYLSYLNIYNNWYVPLMERNVECSYPVAVGNTLSIENDCKIKAPKVMLLGTNLNEDILKEFEDSFGFKFDKILYQSILFFPNFRDCNFEITSDAVYINSNIYAIFGGKLTLNSISKDKKGIIVFLNDCIVYADKPIKISKGCYSFENGTDLIKDAKKLKKLSEIPDYAKIPQSVYKAPKKLYAGETIFTPFWFNFNDGNSWSTNGIIDKSNRPSYIYNNHMGAFVEDNHRFNDFINYWYLNNVEDWKECLPNARRSDDYVSYNTDGRIYVYAGKEINLRYVNPNSDFVIPEFKSIAFRADKITLSTDYKDVADKYDERPKITHEGDEANFYLKPTDKENDLLLYVPKELKVVYYAGAERNEHSYKIKAGYYSIPPTNNMHEKAYRINLFSGDGADYFKKHKPKAAPDSSKTAGGVYTNGF